MKVSDEVKQKNDIVEIISQYAQVKKSGKTFRALCPFHSEKHPSFYIYPEQQSWHCFGACNDGGDVYSFIMKKENMDFGEALRLLAQKVGVTVPSSFEPEAGKEERDKLYEVNQAAGQYFHNLLLNSSEAEKARKYLEDRGLSAKTIHDFQLGFSLNKWDGLKQYLIEKGYTDEELQEDGLVIASETGDSHDRFRNRVIFSISDIRGHVVGFGARVLDDSMPKYLNSPQTRVFDKSSCLYGINLARDAIRKRDMVVIVEGYMDVVTAHQHGFNNVVAAMGTALTERQINILKRLTRNVVLALDADAAGEEATLRAVDYEGILEAEVRVIIVPEGKDPDNVIREDKNLWQNLLTESLPIMDYTFSAVTSGLDLKTAKGKSLAVEKLLPIVGGMKDTIRSAHYIQKLAAVAGVGQHVLEDILRKKKIGSVKQSVKNTDLRVVVQAQTRLVSNPVEEYCLALLLQHPELKGMREELTAEHFLNSENRIIFTIWQQTEDVSLIKDLIDDTMREYFESLLIKDLLGNQIEQKYAECARRLREIYFRDIEVKKADVLALEAETGGTPASIAKLEEQGIDNPKQLGRVFTQRRQRT
ncbi:DNA primase [Chloroflexota bacterium]